MYLTLIIVFLENCIMENKYTLYLRVEFAAMLMFSHRHFVGGIFRVGCAHLCDWCGAFNELL